MPRTFSLGRLMLVITILCVVIGVTLRFSSLASATVAAIGWVAPTLSVLVMVSRHVPQSRSRIVIGVAGAVVASCIFTLPLIYTPPPWLLVSYWSLYTSNYIAIALPPAIGAFLFSVLYPMARVKS